MKITGRLEMKESSRVQALRADRIHSAVCKSKMSFIDKKGDGIKLTEKQNRATQSKGKTTEVRTVFLMETQKSSNLGLNEYRKED